MKEPVQAGGLYAELVNETLLKRTVVFKLRFVMICVKSTCVHGIYCGTSAHLKVM